MEEEKKYKGIQSKQAMTDLLARTRLFNDEDGSLNRIGGVGEEKEEEEEEEKWEESERQQLIQQVFHFTDSIMFASYFVPYLILPILSITILTINSAVQKNPVQTLMERKCRVKSFIL